MRHLQLTEEQETKLITFLQKRLNELDVDNKPRMDADKRSDLDYKNSKDARVKPGTVFVESNMSVPLTCCVVDHFSARTEDELYARKPMASFAPEGPADQETARGLDRYASFKLFKMGRVDNALLEANHTIFRHRAQFLKATYFEDVDTWEEHDVSVLHSGKDQQPVLILEHGYVIEGRDKFIDAVDPITGNPVQVLEVDPTVALDQTEPGKYFFKPLAKPIKFRDVNYSGPKTLEVDSDCIRIPNDARTVDEADIIAEYYDKPSHWIRSRFLDRSWLKWDDYKKKAIRSLNASRKTEDERKKASRDSRAFDLDNASLGVVEIWLERDVLDWGTPQRLAIWYDKKNKILIDYEYQKKVTPNGRHPYTVTAIAKVGSYWWGPSIPEMLLTFQDYIDLQWNRHSFRNSINANPIMAQNPDAIQEKKSFIELKPFDVMTLEQGKSVQDWLQAFVFPNADLDTQELLDKAIEWVYFWLGISNIARGDYSDVPQNTTLGGQEASLKEASKLSKRFSRRAIAGIEDHLTKLVQILLATMNPKEVYTYLEGEVAQLGFITEDSVRDLLVNAKIIVSNEGGSQKMQEQQLTLQTITQYMTYPPQMQAVVRPVMKKILFLLGHDDVETLLPPPMVPMVDPLTGQTVMVPATPNMPPPPTAAPGGPEQALPDEKEDSAKPEETEPPAPAGPPMPMM